MDTCLLAIDQGTSATKSVLVDTGGRIVAKASAPLGERHPMPGWVEQDPAAIWASVRQAVGACLDQLPGARVAGVGLSTQRESALVWKRASGEPLSPLLSWQDQRTVGLRDRLAVGEGVEALVRARSGLPLDPMFSALKIAWLLDQLDPDRAKANAGGLCAGTVDAWLLARLGGGAVIEVGNASRTQLLDVNRGSWDSDLLALFGVPRAVLPELAPSLAARGDAGGLHPRLADVPVHAVMADSHAALFAHGARTPGEVKATMGTGSSVMGITRAGADVDPGLCLTVAWDSGAGPVLALEGNIRAAGATLKWVADLFGIGSDEAAGLAATAGSEGVYLVPGFNGLGAPWWDPHAVGLISGLTLATTRDQLFAAALDSIAHQVADVLDAMDRSVDGISRLLVDGGPSRNAHLRTTLAAYIGRPVVHCTDPELSALGVAHLAGVGAGIWSREELAHLPRAQLPTPVPQDGTRVARMRERWHHAVRQSRL